jgi:hypothetical protein
MRARRVSEADMWVGGWRQMEQEQAKPHDIWIACCLSAWENSESVSVKMSD